MGESGAFICAPAEKFPRGEPLEGWAVTRRDAREDPSNPCLIKRFSENPILRIFPHAMFLRRPRLVLSVQFQACRSGGPVATPSPSCGAEPAGAQHPVLSPPIDALACHVPALAGTRVWSPSVSEPPGLPSVSFALSWTGPLLPAHSRHRTPATSPDGLETPRSAEDGAIMRGDGWGGDKLLHPSSS